ncbi:MAG: tape measure protein, partial [Microcoleus sp.]
MANTRVLQTKFTTEGLNEVLSSYAKVAKSLDDAFDSARKSLTLAKDLKAYGEQYKLSATVEQAEKLRAQAAQKANQVISNSYRELRIRSESDIESMKKQAFAAYRVIATANSGNTAVVTRAQAALSARLKEIDSLLGGVERSAVKASGGFTVLKGAIANVVSASVLNLFYGLGRTVQDLGTNVVKTGADFERVKTALGLFVGSAATTQQVLRSLVDYSGKSLSTLSEIVENARSLSARGIGKGNPEELVDTIKRLDEIAVGANSSLSNLALVYAQVKDQGRTFGQDLNQITNAGISVEDIGKSVGIAAKDVRKFSEDGGLTFEKFKKVIIDVTSEGGKFYGLTEKLATTTPVKLSNLQDALEGLYRSIYDKINPSLGLMLDTITSFGKGLSNSDFLAPLNEELKQFSDYIKSPSGAAEATRLLREGITALLDLIKLAAAAIRAFGPPLVDVIGFVVDWKDAVIALFQAWAAYTVFSKIAAAIGVLQTALAGAAAAGGVMNTVGLAAIGPAGWVVLGASALVVLAANWDKVTAATDKAANSFEDAYKSFARMSREKLGLPESPLYAEGDQDGGALLGITGNTGRSTGPHLDVRYGRGYDPQRRRPTESHLARIAVNGKVLNNHMISSEHRERNPGRPGHDGVEYATALGGRITSTVPIKSVSKPTWDPGGGGYYTVVTYSDGVELALLHQDPSVLTSGVGKTIDRSQRQGPPAPQSVLQKVLQPTRVSTPPGGALPSPGATPDKGASLRSSSAPSGDARRKAFLDLISKTEGANYNTLYGGGTFNSFSQHPGGGPAGRYQFKPATFNEIKARLDLKDFGPDSQDAAAVELLREKGALDYILKGDWKNAIAKLVPYTWSSLPGGEQPRATMAEAIKFLNDKLGKDQDDTASQLERSRMESISAAEDARRREKEEAENERKRKQREAIEGARRVQDLTTQTANEQQLALFDRRADERRRAFDSTAFANISGLKDQGQNTSFYEQDTALRRKDMDERLESARRVLEMEQSIKTLTIEQQRLSADGKKQDAEVYGQKIAFIRDEINYEKKLAEEKKTRAAIEQKELEKGLERDRQEKLQQASLGLAGNTKGINALRPDPTGIVEMLDKVESDVVQQFDAIKEGLASQLKAVQDIITSREVLGLQYQEELSILEQLKAQYLDILDIQGEAVNAALDGAITTSDTLDTLLDGQVEQTETWADALQGATENALSGVLDIMGGLLDGTEDLGTQLLSVVTGFLKQIAGFFASQALQGLMGGLFKGGGGNLFSSLFSSGGAGSFSVGGGGLLGALPAFHSGGPTGTGGEFLARLTGNEFVMSPSATAFYGEDALSRMNTLKSPVTLRDAGRGSSHFAGGVASGSISINVTTPDAD